MRVYFRGSLIFVTPTQEAPGRRLCWSEEAKNTPSLEDLAHGTSCPRLCGSGKFADTRAGRECAH